MKILFLLLTTFALSFINLSAKPINFETAKIIGVNFLRNDNNLMSKENLTLLHKETSINNNIQKSSSIEEVVYYYVFATQNTGFVIVAGDDRSYPILGYSYDDNYKVDNLPPNFRKWMENYKEQLRFIIANNIEQTDDIKSEWDDLINGKKSKDKLQSKVNPLIATKWDQAPYYNNLCPYDYRYNERVVTGCPATAMAQIMKFWNYPESGVGFHSYQHERYGTLSANFGSTYYDWDNMPDKLTGYSSDTEVNAVAKLMLHCGISVEMDYNVAEEGGSGSYVIKDEQQRYSDEQTVEYALVNYFGYASSIEGISRYDYSDNDWIELLKNELDNGRPIQYAGYGNGGHTFVCDGYENNYFHMNWGWGGYQDGYFILDALNPGSGGSGSGAGSYNSNQQALIGIKPPTNEIKYDLILEDDVETNNEIIGFGGGFEITAYISNEGTTTFRGDFCAAVFDKNNMFVDFVEIKNEPGLPPNYHYTNGLKFSTEGILKMMPGKYKIYIFYRPENGNWSMLREGNWDFFTDIYTEIKVVNYNPIKVNSEFSLYPADNIYQGSDLEVNIDILNGSDEEFSGNILLSLYDMDGQFVETIDEVNVESLPSNYHYKDGLTFWKESIEAEPGTYFLAVLHQWDGYDYELTGSTDDYINPIMINIQAAPYQPDIYENNNEVYSAYKFNYSFSNNKASIQTTGSNFHSGNDYDVYSIELEKGFEYEISAKLLDSYSKEDEEFTADGIFSYSLDGENWSDSYDTEMESPLKIDGNKTIYFFVSPFFTGETGTYQLNIEINKIVSKNPIITINGNLNFGDVEINKSKKLVYAISNTGNSDLNISKIDYPIGFSGNWNFGKISAGSKKDIEVTFYPSEVKSYYGNIVVTSDAISGQNSIPVSGKGIKGTSIENSELFANAFIYPNPVSDILHIDLQKYSHQVNQIIIYDLIGNEIINLNSESNDIKLIDVSRLNSGIYYVNLFSSDNIILVQQIVVVE